MLGEIEADARCTRVAHAQRIPSPGISQQKVKSRQIRRSSGTSVFDHERHRRLVRDAGYDRAPPAAGGVGTLRLHRRLLPGDLRLRRFHLPDRGALGFRPDAADVGRKVVPEPAAHIRADHRGRLRRFIHRAGPGRTDVRVVERPGRSAVHRSSGLPGAHHHSVCIRVVRLDRGRPSGVPARLAAGIFHQSRVFLDCPPVPGQESRLSHGQDVVAIPGGRRLVHDAGTRVVGVCVLGSVPLGDFVSPNHAGADVHDVDHLGTGARWPFWLPCRWPDGSDGSGRKSPGASENARSGATTGPGNRAAARRGTAPTRCGKACRSGSSSSRRSSRCCS